MHIAEVVTIAKSLPLLRLNTYKSLILSYSVDYRRIFREKNGFKFLYSTESLEKEANHIPEDECLESRMMYLDLLGYIR